MNKKKSITNYVILSIVAALLICLCFVSFRIPFTTTKFVGYANGIQLGLDLKGGVEAVYEAKNVDGIADYDSALDGTISRLTDLLTDKGYSEATISKQNSDRIRIEIPDVSDPTEVLNMIGEPASLAIRTEEDITAEPVLTGKHIKSAEAGYQNNAWGVVVTFTYEGGEIFKDVTTELASSSGSLHIYLGDATEPFSSATVSEAIAGGSTFISGSMSSQAEAEQYALKITSGTFNLQLNLLSSTVVSATLGYNALLYGLIAGGLGLLLIFIFMIIVYRDLGIIASFSLIFYTIIMVFLLATVPSVQLTLPGIAGIILSLGMAVDANVVVFERMKDEYAHGKRIPACVKAGFKRATISVVDSNVTTIIASAVLYILGTGAIKGFAITLFLGIIVSMFTSLIMTRVLIKFYLPLNSTKPNKLNFRREAGQHEIG